MAPLVTVILTSYNYEQFIGDAIESMLAQTLENWELLIVDDGSTDASWEIIRKFDDPRIKAHRHDSNLGACAAYNNALSQAQGTLIASLDSDDMFCPEKLEVQADFLQKNPSIDICGTHIIEIGRDGERINETNAYANWFNCSNDLNDPAAWLWENRLCHSSAVIRTSTHMRIGEFDNRLIYTPDWQFWLRAVVSGARFAVISEPLVKYRNHGANLTHRNPAAAMRERADSFAEILLPWSFDTGKEEIVAPVLNGFIASEALANDADLRKDIASRLMPEGIAAKVGDALLRIALKQHEQLVLRAEANDLSAVARNEAKASDAIQAEHHGNDSGLTEEVASLARSGRADAARTGSGNASLLEDTSCAASDVMTLRERNSECESRIVELMKSNDWLAENRNSWERAANEQEVLIKELRAELSKLHAANNWMAENRTSWERAASEREARILDLEALVVALAAERKVAETQLDAHASSILDLNQNIERKQQEIVTAYERLEACNTANIELRSHWGARVVKLLRQWRRA